jgi:hypothetical protein
VFPVRYELNLYILFRRISVFKGLNSFFLYFSLYSVKTASGVLPVSYPMINEGSLSKDLRVLNELDTTP